MVVGAVEAAAAVAALFGAWGLCLVVVCLGQDRLIFGRPRSVRKWAEGPYQGYVTESIELLASDGVRLRGWLTSTSAQVRNAVVWFPGRNENIGWVRGLAGWLGPEWAVLAFDYRGLGRSEGRPSEAECVKDGVQIVDWTSRQLGVPKDQVVIVGRSLGSCIGVQVAAGTEVAGVCLIAPPASVAELVKRNALLKPARRWLRHPFESVRHAPQVHRQALVLLAERDRKVPHEHSRRLAEALGTGAGSASGPCRVVTVAGTNHCNIGRQAHCLHEIAGFATRAVARGKQAERPDGQGQNKASFCEAA